MTQTFDIRFARSAGLAALLEVPENVFRWKGGGHLRIDAHGISIGVKRGLLVLLGGKQTQRIPTESLRAVYREGDALRVEFQSGKDTRIVVPFWADDRDTAAKIVRLLPTAQTVEFEEVTRVSKPRVDWRLLLGITVAFSAIAVGSWAVYQRTHPRAMTGAMPTAVERQSEESGPQTLNPESAHLETPATAVVSGAPATTRVEGPAFDVNSSRPGSPTSTQSRPAATSAAEVTTLPEQELPVASASLPYEATSPDAASRTSTQITTPDGIISISRGSADYEAARRQLDIFLAESETLAYWFRDGSQNTTGKSLEELWERVTIRIHNSPDFQDARISLRALKEIELAVSRSWRRALAYYRDPAMISAGDEEVTFALMLQARAIRLVQ